LILYIYRQYDSLDQIFYMYIVQSACSSNSPYTTRMFFYGICYSTSYVLQIYCSAFLLHLHFREHFHISTPPHSCLFNARVRSFSRPEKLWLKIHTGSSGTVYSYWVEKALLFPNWSSFSRQTPSPYVSKFRGFLAVCLYPFALKQTWHFFSLIV
jgi:hypothetical protein